MHSPSLPLDRVVSSFLSGSCLPSESPMGKIDIQRNEKDSREYSLEYEISETLSGFDPVPLRWHAFSVTLVSCVSSHLQH